MNKKKKKIVSFTDLVVWQEGHKLVDAVNEVADRNSVDARELIGDIYELGEEAKPDAIENLLRSNTEFSYAESQETGDLVATRFTDAISYGDEVKEELADFMAQLEEKAYTLV